MNEKSSAQAKKQAEVKKFTVKVSNGRTMTYFYRARPIISSVLAALLSSFVGYSYAASPVLPSGGQTVAGSATISQPNASALLINQGSNSAIINWNSFSIGSGGLVQFVQPGASSVALNRVVGNNPSAIYGQLTANGQIFLVNNSGILFGKGAQVDVGGLVASTLSISDADFMSGKYIFSNSGNAGTVVNQGSINASYAALLAPQVANEGAIVARMGSVALVAGDRVNLDMLGGGLITVNVDKAAFNASIMNKGLLQADGGQVILTARSANALLDTVINMSGVVKANTLVNRNGSILLDGGTAGVVSVTGALDASGTAAGQTGGTVKVLGDKVGLFAGANINVSGDVGGGTALVGGNFHGAGPEHNATQTFVDSTAIINADAITSGNGGSVAVWSDKTTQFNGLITARGGAQGGNGGFVETSGKQTLGFAGLVDATAAHGKVGTLLLDPTSITISTAANTATMVNTLGTFADTTILTPFVSNLNTTTLQTQLGLTNVIVDTTSPLLGVGDITVQSSIAWNSVNSLTLRATNSIFVNALDIQAVPAALSIVNAGTGGLVMTAGTGNITVAGTVVVGGTILAQTNSVAGNITVSGTLSSNNVGATAVTLDAGTANAAGVATGGNVIISGTVGAGAGGTVKIYTGSVAGSTGVTTAVGAGSGKFRYNSNALTTNFVAPIGAGTYAIYRELPAALAVTAVSPAAITYGDVTPALSATVTGMLNGDTIAQVGTPVVTAGGTLSTTGKLTAGAHVLTALAASQLGYALAYTPGSLTVNTKAITATGITATGKVYDAGTVATLVTGAAAITGGATLAGDNKFYTGDAVVLSTLTATGAYANKNVGAAKAVTVAGLALTGADALNYTVVDASAATATITAAPVSLAGARAYNATTNFLSAAFGTAGTLTGVGGETLTLTGTGTVLSANAGAAQALTLGTLALGNGTGLATNYTLVGGTHTGQVNTAVINLSASRAYDGTANFASTLFGAAGTINTGVGVENLVVTGTGTVVSTGVAAGVQALTTGTLALTNGTGTATNYTLVGGTHTGQVTPKALTATVTAPSKVYDGLLTATPTLTVAGMVGTEVVTATGTATFNTKDVTSANLVTVNTDALVNGAGGLASNYSLATGQTVASTIAPKALTATVAAPSKVYDGTTTAAPTLTVTGMVTGEVVTATGTASFNTKDVTSANLVTVNTDTLVSGTGLASNYSLVTGQTVASTITPKALTATVAAPSKVYDGLLTATPTLTVTGMIGTEVVTATGTANFNTKDVTSANLVTVNTDTLVSGTGLASNYSLATGQTVASTIAAKALTATVTAPSKVYDGLLTATPTLTVAGMVGTEVVTATGTATFNTKDVTSANLVTVNTDALVSGTGLASNYSLATGQTVASTIAARAVSLVGTRVYDATTNFAALNFGVAGTVATGVLTENLIVSGTGTVVSSGVAAGAQALTTGTLALGNGTGTASNYTLVGGTHTGQVTAKALTATVTAASKTYDGLLTATPVLTVTGMIGTEVVTATGTATFNTKDVTSANLVTVNADTLVNGTGLASNYSLATGQTVASTIAAKALTATVTAPSKLYDGTTLAAPTLTVTGMVTGEVVTATGTATFNTKDVTSANLVTVNTDALISGTGLASNYSLATGQTVASTITPRALTATVAAPSKLYDGTTAATPSLTVAGMIGTEVVTATGTASFNTKDVTSANLVTVNTDTLVSGTGLASNYSLATGQTVASTITPRALTATVAAASKAYDGLLTATPVLTVTGMVGTEVVTATGTANFNTKDVTSANLVTVNADTLVSGTGLASNYSLVTGQTVASTITPKALTATVAAPSKVYDGLLTATPTLTVTGMVTGEVVTATGTATFNTKDVTSANLVTVNTDTLVSGTGLASNYSLATGQTVASTITPKALTATVAAASKAYDGLLTATPVLTVTGMVTGEVVTATGTATFNTKDVTSANLVTVNTDTLVSGTGLASNYSLATGQTVASTITPKALTATVAAPSKVYDGLVTAAPTLTVAGMIGTEVVTATGTASFNTKDVTSANLVTVNTDALVSGTGLASNYSLATGQTVASTITPKALTATVAAASKAYDGLLTATPVLTVTGMVTGEVVTATGTATFNTKDVTSANLVTVNTDTLVSGTGLASNYSLATGQTVASTITPKALTATVTAPSKVYDGLLTATPTLTVTGMVTGEVVTATGTATFNTKDVTSANLVTVNADTLVSGTGLASNYSLATGQTVASTITPKALTATVAAPSKVYDGLVTAAPTLTVAGMIGTEVVTATGTASFNTKDVTSANLVTVNTDALVSGTGLASNYSLATGQTVASTITPKALTATVAAASKAYDGLLTATPVLTVTGMVTGEVVTATGTATFNTKDVTSANLVTVNTDTLVSGTGLASNYSLATGQTVASTITPKALTAVVAAPNKVYDGTTTATPGLVVTAGMVTGETVNATGTATFNTKDVLTANLVTVNTVGLVDGLGFASNYSLSTGQSVAANILVRTLSLAGSRAYDGSTNFAGLNFGVAGTVATGIAAENLLVTGTGTVLSAGVVAGVQALTTGTLALTNGTGTASNYTLVGGTHTGQVTAKALTATVAAPSKVYDGLLTAAPTLTLIGLVGTEVVTATGTATFNTKDVTSANLVTVNTDALISGTGLASNYSLATGQTVASTIAPKALTATVAAPSKVYDGLVTAAPTLTVAGMIGTEVVTATGTASFNTKDVTSANLVTVNTDALISGTGLASNYSLATGQTVASTITPKALTATVTAASKTYDGLLTATPVLTVTGMVTGEVVTATGTATFNTKDVTSANLVTVNTDALVSGTGLASNYSLATGQTVASTITPKALTATVAAASKAYDGLLTATPVLTVTGMVTGEVVTATGTATFNTKDVTSANLVTVNTDALVSGTGLASNYSLVTGQTVASSITPKALTATVTAPSKVYDGLLTATPTLTVTGMVTGEVVTATGTATFNTKDVTSANLVTVNTDTLISGTGLASNYSLATGQTVASTITPKALTATVTAPSKVYDGLLTAAPTLTVTGMVTGEVVTATGTATFNTKDVTSANLVTVNTDALVSGTGLASNYSLATGQTVASTITPKALTATVAAASKAYDGLLTATPVLTVTGMVTGEVVTATGTATFNTKDVTSANLVTVNTDALVSGTGLASNYSLATGQTVASTITPKALTATVTAPSKVYDGLLTATPTLTVTGMVTGEVVTATGTATFNTKDVTSANLVTVNTDALVSGTGLASNYSLATGQTVASTITPKALTATVTAPSKVYDGLLTAAPTLTVTGMVTGEVVTATGTATFNTKDVTSANLVTVNTDALVSGTGLASNYSLATGQTVASTITPKALTATVAAASKAYDGLLTATPVLTVTGMVTGEVVTATGTATFNTKDVTSANLVTVNTDALISGTGLASNYSLATGQTVASTITPKALTATVAAPGKVYDGTTLAAPTLTVTGMVTGEVVTATGTATFNTKDVTSANLVTVNTDALISGTGLASNYSLATGQTVAAAITAKALTATVTAPSKVYDGLVTAAPTLTVAGMIGTEVVTATGTASFNTKDVTSANLVTVNTDTLVSGTGLASNYSLATGQTVASTITPKALTATVAAPSKVYDGLVTAAPTLTVTGMVTGEVVTATGTATFNTKDVTSANLVTVNTDALISGTGLASNYSLATGQTVASTITPKALTATVAAPGKVYDGTTLAAPTLTVTGMVTGEVVTATGTATFNTKDVTSANLVTVNTDALISGTGLASNYSLATGQTVAAAITAKALTATVAAPNKVYDGLLTATPTFTIATGLVGVETVTATGTATFNTKDVLTANLVTVNTDALVSGTGLASNYSLATGQTVAARITARALTVTGTTAASKVYNGNSVAGITVGTLAGFALTETLTATAVGAFSDANVGFGKAVTATYTLVNGLNGGLATNYSLALTNHTADIISSTPITSALSASQSSVVVSFSNTAASSFGSANIAPQILNGNAGLIGMSPPGINNIIDTGILMPTRRNPPPPIAVIRN